MPDNIIRPSKSDIDNARGKKVPDVIATNLSVLFCGINPSLYTAATGLHFSRPGNRFWPVLYRSHFTDTLFSPSDQHLLLKNSYGITNIVDHATASASDLSIDEIRNGWKMLHKKTAHYKPRILAVLGSSAYGTATGIKHVTCGLQPALIGNSKVWVLPNPSGLNAHYTLDALVSLFGELYTFTHNNRQNQHL